MKIIVDICDEDFNIRTEKKVLLKYLKI